MIARFGFATLLSFAAALIFVLSTGQQASEAVYPGTNGRIAFTNNAGNDTEIWTMNPDGSGRTRITNEAESASTQPAFSPDGEKIAFFRFTAGDNALMTASAGGGGEVVIPNTDDGVQPSWSPDGQKLVFARLEGPSNIYTMNVDGTNEVKLTNTSNVEERNPDWSPLGNKIAFSDGDIWIMNTDGSGKTNLTNTAATFEDNPDWSPDGQRLIFDVAAVPARIAGSLGDREIAVINANGTGFQTITDDPDADQYDPVFSPDGLQIAYVQGPTSGVSASGFGFTGIIVANADGTNAHSISTPQFPNDTTPDWGVDDPGTPPPTQSPNAGETLVWGDNNCSGQADPIDSLLTLRHDAGLSANTGDCPNFGEIVDVVAASEHPWGDVDCGSTVDPIDSLKLLRFDAGLSVSQAVNCPPIGSEVNLVP